LLGALADEYPDVFRFTASVFPAEDDDVVTSPYNSALSAAQLIEHAVRLGAALGRAPMSPDDARRLLR
jgi:hypothetical protein